MKKLILSITIILLLAVGSIAQTIAPGSDILGYGYDVFGKFADNESKKKYPVFNLGADAVQRIGTSEYKVPKNMMLDNIGKKEKTVITGSSQRDYAKSFNASMEANYDGMFFSASVNTAFSKSSRGTEREFFTTIRDANRIWRVAIDERVDLKTILDDQAAIDINSMEPSKLFKLYGTHVIVSAYLGGRADYTVVTKYTEQYSEQDISVAVEGSYSSVSANASTNMSERERKVMSNSKETLTVTGGNAEYANNINNFEAYARWADGIRDLPVLCDFEKGSLLPIWELANSSERKNILKNEFNQLCKLYPFPAAIAGSIANANKVFFVKNVADDLYIDIPGYHMDAHRHAGAKVSVVGKDNFENGLQGIDRFVKVIPHATEPDYVFLQPQHSDLVIDEAGGRNQSGAFIHLWHYGQNNAGQMFKMIPVDGKENTYYLERKDSKFVITAHGHDKQLTIEPNKKGKNQQWTFEPAYAHNMASMRTNRAFAFRNVKGKRYMDLPGANQNAGKKDSHIKLWDLDDDPDRYARLNKSTIDGYYYVQPMHSNYIWDIEGGKTDNGAALQLWDNTNSDNQQFKFIYAGSAMTFFIENRKSGKYIDASDSEIGKNGCKIQLWDPNKSENQQWKLEPAGPEWFAPTKAIKVKVKVAFSNKYWDIEGGGENAGIRGKKLQIWDMDNGKDRWIVIKRSGEDSWVWLETVDGKRIDIHGGDVNISSNGKGMGTWDPHGGRSQKFAIQPTGRYTCAIFSQGWKALDVRGGKIGDNGPDIILWDTHYGASQQYELFDEKGNRIDFTHFFNN